MAVFSQGRESSQVNAFMCTKGTHGLIEAAWLEKPKHKQRTASTTLAARLPSTTSALNFAEYHLYFQAAPRAAGSRRVPKNRTKCILLPHTGNGCLWQERSVKPIGCSLSYFAIRIGLLFRIGSHAQDPHSSHGTRAVCHSSPSATVRFQATQWHVPQSYFRLTIRCRLCGRKQLVGVTSTRTCQT
jgi:hypothetical protein